MSQTSITKREPFSLDALNKPFAIRIRKLMTAAEARPFMIGGRHCRFEPFEGFRGPQRQYDLLTIAKTTKAGPFQSSHQYGLAVDFAVAVYENDMFKIRYAPGPWNWTDRAPWSVLKELARSVGLDIPIQNDLGHVQHPRFSELLKLYRSLL